MVGRCLVVSIIATFSCYTVVRFLFKSLDPSPGGPYTDDCLGSKKLLVCFNFKTGKISKSSQWATRLKNTKESVQLLFKMVHSQFLNTPQNQRRKLTKAHLEEKAEITALACHLASAF